MAGLENILEIILWSRVGFSFQSIYWSVAVPSWSLVKRWCHMAGSHLSGFIAVGSENWQDNAICRAHGAGSNPAYLTYVNSSLHLNSSVLLQTVLICTLQTESRNCFQTFQMELFPQTKKSFVLPNQVIHIIAESKVLHKTQSLEPCWPAFLSFSSPTQSFLLSSLLNTSLCLRLLFTDPTELHYTWQPCKIGCIHT